VGYCDLGAGPQPQALEASEVLLFMLVGLKSRWKVPVAYYLSHGLSAETQTELLLHCIENLVEIGIWIHCLSMDGHASNMAMCTRLGASMDVNSARPYFTVQGSDCKILILMDPCHKVKLVRNILDAYKVIYSPTGIKVVGRNNL